MLLAAALLIAEGALLALAGFWWWPISFLALVPVLFLARAAALGGPLDPVSLRNGIRGEERVASVLAELEPAGFQVLHDLDVGRGNADHVVVGPTGVFVIETKDWGGRFYRSRGRLMFNNRAADEIVGQVTTAALEIRRRLERAGIDVWVQAVVASTRASVSGGVLRLGHLTAVEADGLPAFVVGRRPAMDDGAIRDAVTAILADERR
jgi:hypothetical protein